MPPTSTRRRKRPHPARRARRVTGWLSVVAMAGLTACMAATTKSVTSSTTSSHRSTSSNATSTTTATSDDDSWWPRSSDSPAVAGSASSRPVTASHAS